MFGEKAALGEEAYLQRQKMVEEAKRERLYSQRCPRPRGLSRKTNGTSAPDKAEQKLFSSMSVVELSTSNDAHFGFWGTLRSEDPWQNSEQQQHISSIKEVNIMIFIVSYYLISLKVTSVTAPSISSLRRLES
jgi:hypothetical protein